MPTYKIIYDATPPMERLIDADNVVGLDTAASFVRFWVQDGEHDSTANHMVLAVNKQAVLSIEMLDEFEQAADESTKDETVTDAAVRQLQQFLNDSVREASSNDVAAAWSRVLWWVDRAVQDMRR